MSPSLAPRDPFALARRAFIDRLPGHFSRLGWSAEQVRTHQTAALRHLLRVAIARSPFHARRFGGEVGDIEDFRLEDLTRLPVMTKRQMMDDYDDVTTDRRLTRATVEAFLANVGDTPAALLGDYLVLASGGSSGVRGVFAWPLDVVPDYLSAILRAGLARADGGQIPRHLPTVMVAASSAIHATRATTHIIDGTVCDLTYAPATLPIEETVRRLDAAQPTLLAGYAGVLASVAHEQLAGRLSIHPRMVVSTSEQLTDAARATIHSAFGTMPSNAFGSSEGLNGSAAPGDDVFTFASDTAHVEFVDEHDQPVPTGIPAHHVLVTNLLNTAQPLIRYRLDDSMTPQPALDRSGHQRASLQGRCDETVRFDDRRQVHPIVVRTVLTHHAEATEYQVCTTPHSMHVGVIASGALDLPRLRQDLVASLAAAGITGIDVTVTVADHLYRDPRTGKLPRFTTARAERGRQTS
jgi:phenylacetate-coenzyme A ligase PaaK-like adenylate-forming protein